MRRFSFLLCAILTNYIAGAQIEESFMDRCVRPQDDIYYHVNGTWMKTTEIPADKTRWGSFDILREHTDTFTLGLVKQLLSNEYSKGSDEQKIKDLFATYLDWDSRNKQGISPLLPYFGRIDELKSIKDLPVFLSELATSGKDPLLGIWVENHMKKSAENAVYLGSINLGLGRDYYQKDDAKSKEILLSYTDYLDRLYFIIYPSSKTKIGSKIVDFEKRAASYLLTVENIRNSELQYNPIAVKDLKNLVKSMSIENYLSTQGIKVDTVIIGELSYYKNLDKILNETTLEFLKDYLKIALLNSEMENLSKELDNLQFEFYGKKLFGQPMQREDEKRALAMINNTLGEVLGKVYIKRAFPAEAKETAISMVNYIRKSFKIHIESLTWMSPATKIKALEKLSKFTVKIGYPDKWKDYSKVNILSNREGGSYFSNLNEYRKWRYNDMIAKIGKPVDRSEWGMNPQTVNAYYNPSNNEIVFPAAILQPPFFNFKSNPAVNFGGIGGVIGHEISHGFDDGGCQYDGDGNLNNWWTKEDKEQFDKSTKSLADQYSKYEPLPGVFLNGSFTLGENIADLGGVSVGIDALKMYMKDHPNSAKNISGYTPEEEFFMSWATIWRTKLRDQELINRVKTDPHSPGYYRAIGPLVNVEAYYNTFKVSATDKMYKDPKARIVIW